MKKYVAIYSGKQNWSGRQAEARVEFDTLDELAEGLGGLTRYLGSHGERLSLSEAASQKVAGFMNGSANYIIIRVPGGGAWDVAVTTTAFIEEKKRRREEEEEKRLTELYREKKGWYRVSVELSGNGVTASRYACKDFTGEVIATNKAMATEKGIAEAMVLAPDFVAVHASAEFLGVMTDEGYSVSRWEEWKKEEII